MTTISLGFQTRDYSDCCSPAVVPEPKMKTSYPCVNIPDDTLARSLKAGMEFEAKVKFKATEVAIHDRVDKGDGMKDLYGGGTRVELEMISLTMDNLKVDEDEADGKSAINAYFSKKS